MFINNILGMRAFSFGLLCGVVGYCIAPICWAKLMQLLSWFRYWPEIEGVRGDLDEVKALLRALCRYEEQRSHEQDRKKTKKATPKTHINGAASSSKHMDKS